MKEKRIETIAELENALEEIESGEGLSTFVEGHGLNSHRFRFEWREPLLHISYDLPTGRVLSPEEDQKADDAEAGAAIRLAIVLLRAFAQGKPESFEDGSEWVFKPELAGRLTAPNSPLNIGMNVNQEMTRINLAVQTTANALELDDIMVKTSVGTHNGQFGMFMEKAPGVTGKEFKKSGKSELTQMNNADFGKVVGGMMRKLNRLQWFDIITGQGDRHADNYMINVNKGVPPSVDIKAIDNDASYGVFRQGLHKFVLRDDARTGGMVGIFQDTLNNLAHCITIPKQSNSSNDPQAARANISEKTLEAMTNNGRYVSYSNSFFRDFYDTLIKGSPREDWFAQES